VSGALLSAFLGSPARGVSTWGLAVLLAAPPEGPRPGRTEAPAPPPGGYWSLGERREPEPDDGQTSLTVGAILLGLGAVRTGSGALGVALTADLDRCRDIYGNVPANTCRGLEAYGWVGVGAGALMVVTGGVFLGVGAAAKRRHEAWRLRNSVGAAPGNGGNAWARVPVGSSAMRLRAEHRPTKPKLRWHVAPVVGPRGSGVVAELRF